MSRLRLVALVALALAGAGCGSVPARDGPAAPGPPGRRTVVPTTLRLDLADRAEHDRSLLRDTPGTYESFRDGGDLVLRAAAGTTGPREIRLVPRGVLSRVGLIDAGRLDAADLTEADLVAGSSAAGAFTTHVFEDFERLVLRLGPERAPATRVALWQAVDRAALAEVLFPRTGRAADGCLPGSRAVSVEAAGDILPAGPLTILIRRGDEPAFAAARRIAAVWMAAGVRTRVDALPFPVLRDRLIGGRFDAAVLRLARGLPAGVEAGGTLPPWVCRRANGGDEKALREACGLYPLVSLDRVVGARADLAGVQFDDAGRVDWTAVRLPEAS